ncbi:MAG TPA: DMT family transporter [Ktedonobacteraceae bacterium]|jgi:drug/metabolite transporter (DMT)-like permease
MTKATETASSLVVQSVAPSAEPFAFPRSSRLWKRIRIDALLLLVPMVWGSTFLVTKYMIHVVGLFSYLGYNFGLGALTLVLLFHRRLFRITRSEVCSGVILGALIFAGYACQTIGLQYTTTSKAAFLTGLYVPLVPVFVVLLFRQRIKTEAMLGIGFSLLGLILLSINKDFTLAFGGGEALVTSCALAFALHIVFLGKVAPRNDTMNLSIVQLATTSLFCFIAAVLTHQSLVLPASLPVWGVVLFMGVLDLALCMAIMNWAQQFVSSTHAALIYACEPVWAGIFGVLTGQILSPLAWVGGCFICVGMVLSEIPLSSLRLFFWRSTELLDHAGQANEQVNEVLSSG